MKKYILLLMLTSCVSVVTSAQSIPVKNFGNVTADEFTPARYAVDSTADAVYIFDVGSTIYMPNKKGYFNTRFTRHARIRLLQKNSFASLATISVPLIVSSYYEQVLIVFHAAIYNIENGKVVAEEVDQESMMKEKTVKARYGNLITNKYTFPQVKEGCIIEYEYTVEYPGIYIGPGHVHSWYFQGDYPCLWSRYELTQPACYTYLITKRGQLPYDIDAIKDTVTNFGQMGDDGKIFSLSNILSINTKMINHVWAIKDVPSIKKEPFITSMTNYFTGLQFQLYAIQYPNDILHRAEEWCDEINSMLEDDDFGLPLREVNSWANDVVKAAAPGLQSKLEKAQKIYAYIRDNFNCTDHEGIWLEQPLKKTLQSRAGTVADINLLLTAVFIKEGFVADPVLVSTRDNGIAPEAYPDPDNYNYLVTQLKIGENSFLLDAASKFLSFGHLAPACYNGSAKIINKSCGSIMLSSDSLMESAQTSVFIINAGGEMDGSSASNLGYNRSVELREKLFGKKQEDLFNDIKKDYPLELKMTNTAIDSLTIPEYPVAIKYDMKFNLGSEDIIYFNPVFDNAFIENPFKAATRLLPVQMPYCSDDTYLLNMEIPTGYAVDELPKSARVNLNEDDGFFEYIIAKSATHIQLKCRLKLNKANFAPVDYPSLRDFYSFVVSKEAEQVVFKKIQ